jgi:hypothetical protein
VICCVVNSTNHIYVVLFGNGPVGPLPYRASNYPIYQGDKNRIVILVPLIYWPVFFCLRYLPFCEAVAPSPDNIESPNGSSAVEAALPVGAPRPSGATLVAWGTKPATNERPARFARTCL